MKHQALFSSKDKSKKKIKVSAALVSLGSFRVNQQSVNYLPCNSKS